MHGIFWSYISVYIYGFYSYDPLNHFFLQNHPPATPVSCFFVCLFVCLFFSRFWISNIRLFHQGNSTEWQWVQIIFKSDSIVGVKNSLLVCCWRKGNEGWNYLTFIVSTLKNMWAEEMGQLLRALTALPKVLSSIPSNHIVAHNHL